MKRFCLSAALAVASGVSTPVFAADYYYNTGLANGSAWSGSTNWSTSGSSGPYDTNWVNNNTAVFVLASNRAVELEGSTISLNSSGGIYNNSSGNTLTIRSTYGGVGTLDFSGGTFRAGNNNGVATTIHASVTLKGNLTLASGVLDMTSTMNVGVSGYTGTMTTAGGLLYTGASRFSGSSHLVNTGASIYSENAGTYNIGSLTMTQGNYYVGVLASSGTVNSTVHQLSGSATGGNIQARLNNLGNGLIHTFTVDQSSNTVYNGNLVGDNTAGNSFVSYFRFTKSGSGSLSLGGNTIRLLQGTTVSAGTLLIDGLPSSSTRTFDNIAGGAGSAAITVQNGGALGGVSTVTVLNGRHVVVEQGGGLVPGSDGTFGRLTLNFGSTGGELDLLGGANGTGWLKFDLGSDATAGTTYDNIRVVGSSLAVNVDIGAQLLNFDDFSFSALAGFGEGIYTLFTLDGTAALNGSLGNSLSGVVASGYLGTLSLSGNNILLTVAAVPEPGSIFLVLGGAAVILGRMARMRRKP